MTTFGDLLARAPYDPLVRYALLATAVLAIAAVIGGLARRDLVALARPATWLAIAAALLAALASDAAQGALLGTADVASWARTGWDRPPLYLLAIGYGPSVGVVAGALLVLADLGPGPLPIDRGLLLLELAAVGWLALGPTPRRTRWAAPLAVLAGWALATVTLGSAAWAADGRARAWAPFLHAHLGSLAPVAVAAVLGGLPSPGWWRRVPGASDGVLHLRDDERARWLRPLRRPPSRRRTDRPRTWPAPRRPRPLRRDRRPARRAAPVATPAELQRPDARPDEEGISRR